MKSTASSYFIPSSISASATITGARPRPATQCTATQESGFSRNLFFSNSNHSSTTCNLPDHSTQYKTDLSTYLSNHAQRLRTTMRVCNLYGTHRTYMNFSLQREVLIHIKAIHFPVVYLGNIKLQLPSSQILLTTLLFNSASYVILLLCLCILIVMYVLFCIFCFHHAIWHSSATLTEVFACFFLSCKANARV